MRISKKIKTKRTRRFRLKPTIDGHFGNLKSYLLALMIVVAAAIGFAAIFLKKEMATMPDTSFDNLPSNVAHEEKLREMVKGYPIESMVRKIARKDEKVAAYMISIAKKESNWGKRVPVLNGKDCYNYWGYRAKREKMGSGGHTCFDSPQDAVNTVAKRIEKLIYDKKLETPKEMVVWKCGSNCEGHDPYSVSKWIADVNLYYSKLTSNN